MPDPLTSIIVATGGVIASKDLLNKLLGPTADYLGESTRDLVKKSAENIGRILRVAYEKLEGQLERPGQVNSRVFKNVWDEGRFVEDVFSSEYFGGLLASSRTEDGNDDSAVPFVTLVKSLSSYQLRLHFIIYSLVAQHADNPKFVDQRRFWHGLKLHVSGNEIVNSMGLERDDRYDQLLLALTGLIDHRLLDENYMFDIISLKGSIGTTNKSDGVIVRPNERGARLFLRALGLRGLSPDIITSVNIDDSLSAFAKSAIQYPNHAMCSRQPRELPTNDLHEALLEHVEQEIDSLRDSIEEKIADLESRLDDID